MRAVRTARVSQLLASASVMQGTAPPFQESGPRRLPVGPSRPNEAVAAGSPYRYPLWLARTLNSAIYDVKWDYEGYRTTARIAVFLY